jgi:O-antigen/teichoic acid export membrane protein
MAMGIAVGARPAIRLLTEPSYHSAALLVPLIVVAYVLHAWVDAVKFGIDVAERTIYFTYASWVATLVVLGGYVLLIPSYGAIGAAMATIIAFAVRFALTLHWAQGMTPLEYGWPRIIRLVGIAAFCAGATLMWAPGTIAADMLLAGISLVSYAVCVWTLILDRAEQQGLVATATRTLGKLRPNSSN